MYISNPPTAVFESCIRRNNSGYQAGALTASADPDTPSEFELSHCRFEGNRASQQGGAVWSKGANVTFVHSSCIDNSALVGGCLHAAGIPGSLPTHVTFVGCQLLNNTAQQSAGAVWLDTVASAVLQDTNVSYNSAKLSAGALYFHSSSGSLENVELLANAAQSAGAVMLEGAESKLAVTNSRFKSNKVGCRCGYAFIPYALEWCSAENLPATLCTCTCTLIIRHAAVGADCMLIVSTSRKIWVLDICVLVLQAADRAGAVQVLQASISLVNSSLTNNAASSAAGGIFLQDGATLSCKRCILKANQAAIGGAIAAESSAVELTGTAVEQNIAPSDLVSVATAAGQQPAGSGAGIWAHSSTVKLTDSRFDFNKADLQGGAIHAVNSSTTVSGASFVGNKAQRARRSGSAGLQESFGGAIYAVMGPHKSSLQLRKCVLSLNVAGTGGAIAVVSHSSDRQQAAELQPSTAAGRKLQQAKKPGNGAVAAAGVHPATAHKVFVLLEGTHISNNVATAGSGGGLYSSSPFVFVNITSSNFSSNTATRSGGGAAVVGATGFSMQGGSITGNMASSCGGLLLLHPETAADITQSSFTGNLAAAVISAASEATRAAQGSNSSSTSSSGDDSSLGQLPVYNSTGSGGALCVVLARAPVEFHSSSMTGNTALHGGEQRQHQGLFSSFQDQWLNCLYCACPCCASMRIQLASESASVCLCDQVGVALAWRNFAQKTA
jgi:hypothetical protein